MEGEVFIIFGGGLFGRVLTCHFGRVVLSIDEPTHAAKEFLGPYTAEEHGKRGNAVHGPRLNHVCSGHRVRLSEHKEPDDELRERKHSSLACDESPNAIPVVPLRAAAPDSPVSGFVARGAITRPKDQPPMKQGAPLAIPSLARWYAHPEEDDVGDFEVIDICPEEESGDSTPSEAYFPRDGVEPLNPQLVPLMTGRNTTDKFVALWLC